MSMLVVARFLIPLVVCLACLVCPFEKLFRLDDYFCEDEAKQVLMAASVTVVMLLQQQLPKRAPACGVVDEVDSAAAPCL